MNSQRISVKNSNQFQTYIVSSVWAMDPKEKIYQSDLSYPIEEEPKCLVYRVFGQVPARMVLYMLSWSGFLVSFMMRTDINLAIVEMVKEPTRIQLNNTYDNEKCYTLEVDLDGTIQEEMKVSMRTSSPQSVKLIYLLH